MRNKNILLTVLLSLLTFVSFSQITAIQKKADKFFNEFSYTKAIQSYLSINEKDISVKRNLAKAYYNLSNFADAETWSAEVLNMSGFLPDDVRRYAYVLKINEKYTESESMMDKFYSLNSSDTRAIDNKKNKNLFSDLQSDKNLFIIKNLDMNGPAQEFSPVYYKDDIVVFTSSRSANGPIGRSWNGNNLSFLNFFKGTYGDDMELNDVKPFYNKINKKWHDGPVSFNEDGTYMVYTTNNYSGDLSEKTSKLMMYYSEYKDSEWTKGVAMPFNNKEYSVGHASLSPDGKTMYFSSDMPGGHGSIDIYKSTRLGLTWSKPINLGPTINTEGREAFPFIDSKGKTLYYSSDGLYGLGGYDIFMSSVRRDKYSKPVNLGFPINGSHDDFALVIDKELTKGYFTSNRPDGHGDDDIYSFRYVKPFCKSIKGTAKDKVSLLALGGVTVNLFDKDGNVVKSVETLDDGKYEFCIEGTDMYALKGNKETYTDGENSVNLNTQEEVVIADLFLSQADEFILYNVVTDSETGELLQGVRSSKVNCDGSESNEFITSTNGDFTSALNNKLNDDVCFKIIYEKEGYESSEYTYNFNLDHSGQYNINESLVPIAQIVENTPPKPRKKMNVGVSSTYRDLLALINSKEGEEIFINPIYFDVNKYDIRTDAKIELDKIVRIMTNNPDLELELSSHTDCRASKKYNQTLSQNRANASLRYIQSRIADSSRIKGQGYGETRLANGCVCEPTNDSDCNKTQHQKNRRTEFVIISQ